MMYPKAVPGLRRSPGANDGPVAALPTPVYFYGMAPGDEITVEIDQGKALVVSLTAIGETEEDGNVRLFFELNGQPRIVTMANRKVSAAGPSAVSRTPRTTSMSPARCRAGVRR